MSAAEEKYSRAVELYKTTGMTITAIARLCGVSRSGLAVYIQRNHRDLMFDRHCVDGNTDQKLRPQSGQSPATRKKYQEAIRACDSEEFINLNISQIARMFGLNETNLGGQLRAHYPEILERREAERRRRGIADNLQRGAMPVVSETYESALEMLTETDMTIREVADACGVSFSGLQQHLRFYHKDIVTERSERRRAGMETPIVGKMAGNGKRRTPSEADEKRFAEAVDLYRTTSLAIPEICERTGVDKQALKNHLREWHRDLIYKRRGITPPPDATDREPLRGLRSDQCRADEKYAEAIDAFCRTSESLASIASRMGLNYKSLDSFMRHNHPDAFSRHPMKNMPRQSIHFVVHPSHAPISHNTWVSITRVSTDLCDAIIMMPSAKS